MMGLCAINAKYPQVPGTSNISKTWKMSTKINLLKDVLLIIEYNNIFSDFKESETNTLIA